MSQNEVNNWFLIQLKPNSHRIAERNLKRQGYDTFLPIHEITKRKKQKFIKELRPLFPGYMFVKFNPMSVIWKSINGTFGVSRLVSFGKKPTAVPSDLIMELIKRCDEFGKIIPMQKFEVGNKVEVINGPFAKFIATVDNINSEERVYLLLNYMGQNTRIKVEKNNIKNIV